MEIGGREPTEKETRLKGSRREGRKEGRETCLRLKEEEEDRGNKKRSGPSQGPEE